MAALAGVWTLVYLIDGTAFLGSPPILGGEPIFAWELLFPNGPVEWLQWLALAAASVGSAYLAGRLHERGDEPTWRLWALLAAGLALMLVEDAGDIRHVLVGWTENAVGESAGPIPVRYTIELPYFAGMVALPVYAVARYGKVLWRCTAARPYALAGFGAYGLVGVLHVPVGPIGTFKHSLGAAVDTVVARGSMALPEELTRTSLHSALADGPVEESLELLAAACLLAMIVTFARDRQSVRRPQPADGFLGWSSTRNSRAKRGAARGQEAHEK